jgi:hypothetical protein
MVTIVEMATSSVSQFFINKETDARKKIPQIKDSRERNLSQFKVFILTGATLYIRDTGGFGKIALFCQLN